MATKSKLKKKQDRDQGPWLENHGYVTGVVLLIALAAVVRIYGAWAFRFITDGDSGIVGLMARHMAQGEPWPVFFYGQAYMGSFEPGVSALMCRFFGIHGFSVCLGSAVLAIAALISLALWAREAGGKTAALVALALCVVGPRAYFLFQFAPRGGYMAALFCGTWVMFYGSRMAGWAWDRDREQVGAGSFLLLGFVAGLGWWSNAIVTPALVATALVLMIGLRGRFWIGPVWAGLAGFLLGSTPFWYWNVTHEWASFGLLSSVGTQSLADGVSLLWPRLVSLTTLDHWPGALSAMAVVLFLVPVVWGLVAGCLHLRKGWNPSFTCAVLFVVLSLALFVRSDYASMNTARYLIPLVPALALMSGVGVARTPMPWRAGVVAVLPVVILLQFSGLSEAAVKNRSTAAGEARVEALAGFLEDIGIEAAYAHLSNHSLNFLLEERWAFTDMRKERYLPIARRAELSERVAVLDNFGRISDFLVNSGGHAELDWLAGFRVEHDFAPPVAGLRDVGTSALAAMEDGRGTDLLPVLRDLNEDTHWDNHGGDPERDFVEARFASPQPLRAIRLLGPPGSAFPAVGRVEVRRPGQAEWEVVLDDHPVSAFFWSGPRPYWSQDRMRLVYRLDDRPVEAVRLAPPFTSGRRGAWQLSECGFFVAGSEPPSLDSSWTALSEILWEGELQNLYCPRWVANRIHQNGDIEIDVPLCEVAFPGDGLGDVVDLTSATGVLVPTHEALATREVLTRHGLTFNERTVARWVLFEVTPSPSADRPAPPVVWTGFGLVTGNSQAYAGSLLEAARAMVAGRSPASAVAAMLEEAYAAYPGSYHTSSDVLHWVRERDPQALAGIDVVVPVPGNVTSLLRDAPVTYNGDIALFGVLSDTNEIASGGSVDITYIWRCPSGYVAGELVVFAHFLNGDYVVQDDHVLLEIVEPRRLRNQFPGELFAEDRTLVLPDDSPPGTYDLHIGLYRSSTGQRLKPDYARPTPDHKVLIEGFFRVTGPAA